MTEEKNPPTPRAGIFLFLGKRKTQRRAFHIPTAPATAVRMVQNLNLKGASSSTRPGSSQAHSSIGKDSEEGREQRDMDHISYGDPHGPKHVLYVREQASTPVGFTGN